MPLHLFATTMHTALWNFDGCGPSLVPTDVSLEYSYNYAGTHSAGKMVTLYKLTRWWMIEKYWSQSRSSLRCIECFFTSSWRYSTQWDAHGVASHSITESAACACRSKLPWASSLTGSLKAISTSRLHSRIVRGQQPRTTTRSMQGHHPLDPLCDRAQKVYTLLSASRVWSATLYLT